MAEDTAYCRAHTDAVAEAGSITIQEWVYRQVKEHILLGRFVPGRSVTLRGIASMLNVSPTPVREALRRLVSERALTVHGNRRVGVPSMTRRRFDDLCTVRISLETLAAERAMPHVDAARIEHLRCLDAAIDKAVDKGDVSTYLKRHREFHYDLYTSGSADVLLPLIDSVWLQFSPFLRLVIHHIGTDYIVDRHAEAISALERGDGRALRFAIEADVREGLGSLSEAEWRDLEAESGAFDRGPAPG